MQKNQEACFDVTERPFISGAGLWLAAHPSSATSASAFDH